MNPQQSERLESIRARAAAGARLVEFAVDPPRQLLADIDLLLSLLPQWQPIESAPKDGTYVLLYWPYWSKRAIIGYCHADQWYSEWALSTDGDGPICYQPLPAPPTKD